MIEKPIRLLWGGVPFLAGLLLVGAMSVLFGTPGVANADEPVCGDAVCDPATESSDLCVVDCECMDNGVVDIGEGCGCKDGHNDPRYGCFTATGFCSGLLQFVSPILDKEQWVCSFFVRCSIGLAPKAASILHHAAQSCQG